MSNVNAVARSGPEGKVAVWSIPLSLFLGGMVFFYFIPLPCLYPVAFFPYCFEGRLTGYFPTISETGIDYPNTEFNRFSMGSAGMINFYSLLALFYAIEYTYRPTHIVHTIRWICVIVASVGTTCIGWFSLATHHDAHFTSTSTAFFSVCVFQFVDLLIMSRNSSWLVTGSRVISLMLQVVALIVFAFARWILNPRVHDTISTLCEYGVLISLGYFYSTYSAEFKGLELSLFIAE
jgi:hypothetical protein